ncbi:MAG TPA: carboxymuconolactone decarboxylase family protein [Jiangellaceae bacterium]
MPYLPSLKPDAVLLDVLRSFPTAAEPLLAYHEALLRGPSPFTVAERELIAAYTSGLNACGYCHGVHSATAEGFGVPKGTLQALLDDVDAAPVDERMRPVLRYVRKLTESPSRIAPSDVEAILAAGWDEQAVHDAAAVCGLFNLMNRLVDGLGITADEDYFAMSSRRLAAISYTGLRDLL